MYSQYYQMVKLDTIKKVFNIYGIYKCSKNRFECISIRIISGL